MPAQLASAVTAIGADQSLPAVRLQTGLDTLLDLVSQRVANLRVPILLVVFQMGAVALAVFAGVGALTLSRQSFELSVLHSRGFSRRVLMLGQAVQAVLAAAVAYPLGLIVGIGLAKLAAGANGSTLPGRLFPVRLSPMAELLGLGAAAAGVAILLLLSIPAVARTVLEQRHVVSREDRPLLARLPVELFVAPVGIFAFLQLRSGSTTPTRPGAGIDPLLLLAPTLLIFAASFLALRVLLFALKRVDERIGRSRRVTVYLAARRIGRSPGVGFAAALLLLLSTGLVMVSTSYHATVVRSHEDTARQQLGSDWNVQIAPPEQPLVSLGTLPSGTTAVLRTDPILPVGGFSVAPEVLAVDPATYAAGGWWRDDDASRSLPELLDALQAPRLGAPLPGSAETLHLQIDAPTSVAGARVAVTTEAPDGSVGTTEQPLSPGSAPYELSVRGADRLLSIVWVVDSTLNLPERWTFVVSDATIDATPFPLVRWEAITWRGSHGSVTVHGSSLKDTFSAGVGDVIGGMQPQLPTLPAVMSPQVGSVEGPSFAAGIGGQQTAVHQIAVAATWPSELPDAPFLVVSARALLERQVSIPEPGIGLSEVWARGDVDPRPALTLAGFAPGFTTNTRSIEAGLAALPQSLAVGMLVTASAGGLALVVIGVAMGLYFGQRRRDYEFAALRAMGAEPSQLRRTLVLEQAVLLGFAVTSGLAIGYAMLRVMMPYVARSLASAFPAPVLALDVRALAASVLAMVVASAFGLTLAVRSLLHSSVTGVLRGEAE